MTRYVIPLIAILRHGVLSEIQAKVTVTLKIHVTMVTDISDLYLFTIDTLLMSWRMLIVRLHTTYHVRRTSYDVHQVIFVREVWPYEKFSRKVRLSLSLKMYQRVAMVELLRAVVVKMWSSNGP